MVVPYLSGVENVGVLTALDDLLTRGGLEGHLVGVDLHGGAAGLQIERSGRKKG